MEYLKVKDVFVYIKEGEKNKNEILWIKGRR